MRERDDFDACGRVDDFDDVWACREHSLNACGRVVIDFCQILMRVGVS